MDGRDIQYNGALRALARPGRLTLWIKPGLGPWLARRRAAKFEAVVQAKRPVVPEFELCGHDPPAAPSLRARHFPDDVLGGELDGLFVEPELWRRGLGAALVDAATHHARLRGLTLTVIANPTAREFYEALEEYAATWQLSRGWPLIQS